MLQDIVYMAVSADKYELPIYVADTVKELSELTNIKRRTISVYISTARAIKHRNMKLIRVNLT